MFNLCFNNDQHEPAMNNMLITVPGHDGNDNMTAWQRADSMTAWLQHDNHDNMTNTAACDNMTT
jgi:hypothetical protein